MRIRELARAGAIFLLDGLVSVAALELLREDARRASPFERFVVTAKGVSG